MGGAEESPGAVREVRARRICIGEADVGAVEETVAVVRETSLTVDVSGVGSYTLLCTPGDERALALGFLLSEGLIDGTEDVAELRPCREIPRSLRVRLARKTPLVDEPERSLLIVSSCGACGSEGIEERVAALPVVGDSLQVDARALYRAATELRESQALFAACGGTHAVALFDAEGRIVAGAEDAGRHNALDKAIGKRLLDKRSPAGLGAVLSGRASLEMLAKCARAGIELLTAVSAPTSLAIEVAERCNITLCAFVRGTRATVFACPERIERR
jgi:FdhD protein